MSSYQVLDKSSGKTSTAKSVKNVILKSVANKSTFAETQQSTKHSDDNNSNFNIENSKTGINTTKSQTALNDNYQNSSDGQYVFSSDFQQDVLTVFRVAFPAMITSFSQFSLLLIQQIFVARIGNDELAAVGVSNTWLNPPVYFILGLMTALDTLASQSYGAGDKVAIMRHWTESIVTMCILSIPLVGLLSASGAAARTLFGQTEEIASLVGNFCYWAAPGLLFQTFGTTVIKVLQSQNILMAPALITVFVFIIFIPIQLKFIDSFGFVGSSIALSFVRFLWMVLILVFWAIVQLKWWKNDEYLDIDISFTGLNIDNNIHTHKNANISKQIGATNNNKNDDDDNINNKKCTFSSSEDSKSILNAFSDEQNPILNQDSNLHLSSNYDYDDHDLNCLPASTTRDQKKLTKNIFTKQIIQQGVSQGINSKNIIQFLKLGLAGGFMLTADAVSFDIPILFAARLGTAQVDAHMSALITGSIAFVTFTLSIALAATILVGNQLGAKNPKKAKQLGLICVFLASFFMTVSGVLMVIFRGEIGYVYSDDENIVSLIKSIVFPLAAFQLLDGVQGSCQGVLRGCGRQLQLFVFNIAGFWGCGVPMEILLCFVLGFGLQGIWWGISFGVLIVAILTVIFLVRIDWEKEVYKVQSNDKSRENENQSSDEDLFGKLGEKYNSEQKDVELVPLV